MSTSGRRTSAATSTTPCAARPARSCWGGAEGAVGGVPPRGLEQRAVWLARAGAPGEMGGTAGRHPEAVEPLVDLAELLGMRLVDRRGPLNVPFDHPLVADNANAAVREADVVLLIDVDVAWIPRHAKPAHRTRNAQLDIHPLK